MSKIKYTSPFMVYQNFLSPKQCEEITYKLDFFHPDVDPEGNAIKSYKTDDDCQQTVFDKWDIISDNVAKYYGQEYHGTEPIIFEWFPTGTMGEPVCESAQHIAGKWTRTRQRDISAILFLSDYCDSANFDTDYEVYGGKLEFPSHAFGFNPQRGTLIVYPSGPHFVNVTSNIFAGSLTIARIQMATQKIFVYDPKQFPGTYTDWFEAEL